MRAIAVAAFAAAVAFAQSTPAVKKRIAIFDFENAAASGAVSSTLFSTTGPNTGNAVANLLINRLVQNANATIIERAAIDKLIAAQNLSNSDRTDPLTAAKLGPILGVDAIILAPSPKTISRIKCAMRWSSAICEGRILSADVPRSLRWW